MRWVSSLVARLRRRLFPPPVRECGDWLDCPYSFRADWFVKLRALDSALSRASSDLGQPALGVSPKDAPLSRQRLR